MRPQLFLTKRFQKSYEKLDAKVQTRVKKALNIISNDPTAGKPLTGELKGEYSYRIGNWRIIYTIERTNIWLETVGHRREVYKKR
ncbi:MAG: type II toxin-antitoxin system RelE/ParE family toxin [Actinobacteria bacterium]|nr:MAG: type II toxin-antitoxin system RelE/ParE family toxin [Actinomycetota bacterium]